MRTWVFHTYILINFKDPWRGVDTVRLVRSPKDIQKIRFRTKLRSSFNLNRVSQTFTGYFLCISQFSLHWDTQHVQFKGGEIQFGLQCQVCSAFDWQTPKRKYHSERHGGTERLSSWWRRTGEECQEGKDSGTT